MWDLRNLPWLPNTYKAGADIDAALSALIADGADPADIRTYGVIARQSSHASAAGRLARVLRKNLDMIKAHSGAKILRVALLSNATTDLLGDPLLVGGARFDVLLETVSLPFGQPVQMALDPHSDLYKSAPDAVIVALDHRYLTEDGAEAALADLHVILNGLRQNGMAQIFVQSMPATMEPTFGSFDVRLNTSREAMIAAFNHALPDILTDAGAHLFDVAGLAARVGLGQWHNMGQWYAAKLAFDQHLLGLYGNALVALIAAAWGKARKCIVVDLDNTLWGGVVGDDGPENLRLANGDALGEAFRDFQRTLLALRDRGVVLAISSKNDHDVAVSALDTHPDMLLRTEHFACIKANWSPKSENIRAIADELSLGLDSLVFVDDNPAERHEVRRALPMVAIPEMPADPALYACTLLNAGYFEAVALTDEDRGRADAYAKEQTRKDLFATADSHEAYLVSLKMTAVFAPVDAQTMPRVHQLINKTNQFNLTTRRYSAEALATLMDDEYAHIFRLHLSDRFGDNGLISVVIVRADGDAWHLDTWLMSCRVLGRGVEKAMLNQIADAAQLVGVTKLIGVYRPTERNTMVKNHYPDLGFTARTCTDDEAQMFDLALSAFVPLDAPVVFTAKD